MPCTISWTMQALQRDPGDQEENTCLVDSVGLPQGNFRAILDTFNEGKLLHILAASLVKVAPESSADTGFLVRDEDFTASQTCTYITYLPTYLPTSARAIQSSSRLSV